MNRERKETPLIFSGPMVRAILQGHKTMTRRVIVPQPVLPRPAMPSDQGASLWVDGCGNGSKNRTLDCPFGQTGDLLWVKETFWLPPPITPKLLRRGADTWPKIIFDSDCDDADRLQWKEWGWKRKPSIFMPKRVCRLRLEVVSVRIEPLNLINYEDEGREGIICNEQCNDRHSGFIMLWDSINAKRGFGWVHNPWVWVIEFKERSAGE